PEKSTVLLPHLCKQSDSHGGSESGRSQQRRHSINLHAGRGSDRRRDAHEVTWSIWTAGAAGENDSLTHVSRPLTLRARVCLCGEVEPKKSDRHRTQCVKILLCPLTG